MRNPLAPMLVIACSAGIPKRRLGWRQAHGKVRRCRSDQPRFRLSSNDLLRTDHGANLKKRFLAFRDLAPSDCLADVKLFTIDLERQLAQTKQFPDLRPLNLDPGLLQMGKFLLATTKDQAHRIYLRDGIFAEVTLCFHDGVFDVWPWTYRDYREPAVLAFLQQARET